MDAGSTGAATGTTPKGIASTCARTSDEHRGKIGAALPHHRPGLDSAARFPTVPTATRRLLRSNPWADQDRWELKDTGLERHRHSSSPWAGLARWVAQRRDSSSLRCNLDRLNRAGQASATHQPLAPRRTMERPRCKEA